jgi:imidazoleglycerol-phosphate dehydratase
MTTDSGVRQGVVNRTTNETDIKVSFSPDGQGKISVSTEIPFFDHMLTLFGVHGFFDLDIKAKGDIDVDYHHTVEDVGICLGQALAAALGNKAGIKRYGLSYVPMDETLVRVVVDVSNRPYLYYDAPPSDQKIGSFDTCLAQEFMRAFSQHAGLTLHVELLHGENSHHIIEAVFKALGRSINDATTRITGMTAVLSSKGCL